MKKIKKQLLIVLSVLCCVVLAIGLTACGKTEAPKDGKSAIDLWLELPENSGKTSEDFWKELKGEKGDKGDKGDNGAQGEKGDKGDKGDQGAQGEKGDKGDQGEAGKSAYEVWKGLEGNADKTEAEFIEALKGAAGVKGDKGDKGDQGDKGDKGDQGEAGNDGVGIKTVAVEGNQFVITLTNDTVVKVNIPAVSNTCEHDYDKWMLQEHKTKDTMNVTLKICKKCGASVLEREAGHVWGDATTVAPTCTTEGYDARLCTICKEADVKTNIKPALNHEKDGVSQWEDITIIEGDKNETMHICEAPYFTAKRCKLCGTIDDATAVKHEPKAHEVADKGWKLDENNVPTLTKTGKIIGKCETCNKTIDVEIPAVTEADYTIDGNIKVCNATGFDVEVTLKAHDYIKFTVSVPAKNHTYKLSDGEKYEVSSEVVTITEADITAAAGEIPAIRLFDNVVKTCAASGMSAFTTCADCGKEVLITVKFQHAPKADDKDGLAAVAEKHYTACGVVGQTGEFTCQYCNQKVTLALPALVHKLGYKVEANAVVANAKQTFKVTEICERNKAAGYDYDCNHSTLINRAAEGKLVEEKDPTCNAEGYKKYELKIAGETKVITVTLSKTSHYVLDKNNKPVYIDDIAENGKINYDKFVAEYGEGLILLFDNKKPTCTTPESGRYVCANPECKGTMIVTLIREHLKPTDESAITHIPATCDEPEKIKYICQYEDHKGEVIEKVGKALGHDLVYTYDEATKMLVVSCSRKDVCKREDTTMKVVDTKVTPATCTTPEIITYIGEDGKTVKREVGEPVHSLIDAKGNYYLAPDKGVYTPYTVDGVHVFSFSNVPPACSSKEGTDGYYICAICGATNLVKVRADHKMIEGSEHIETPATCETDGDMTYKCSTCDPKNNVQHKVIPAKGHDLAYAPEVREGKVVVTETCKREGCVFSKTTTVGDLDNAEIFTKNEDESKEATCLLGGTDVYDFEFTNVKGEKVNLKVEVDVDKKKHDTTDERPEYWIDAEGNKYVGFYCKWCKQYIYKLAA